MLMHTSHQHPYVALHIVLKSQRPLALPFSPVHEDKAISVIACVLCSMLYVPHINSTLRPQATIGARASAPSSSSHCASHGGPLTYDSNPLCALSLSCVVFHRLNVFIVCCHAYICASLYSCRTQDANAAGAHRGAHERAPSAPRGGGEGLRQASCNHTDVCIAQAGGSPPTVAAWCVT